MSLAIYVRVSTQRQAQAQTIEQQLERLRAHIQSQGWDLTSEYIFRDDGYSGASLNRPGLDRLRDAVRAAEVDRVLITDPDRLARVLVPVASGAQVPLGQLVDFQVTHGPAMIRNENGFLAGYVFVDVACLIYTSDAADE